jgi:membrane protease YdiL (CAAX protease family)
MALIRERPLATFFVGSVAIGWAVTALSMQLPGSAILLPLVAIPVSYVPAAMAFIVLRIAGSADERGALRRRLTTFRVGWMWYAVALLVLPLIHVAGVGLAALTGARIPFEPAMIALLPLFLFTNLGEEIGWRGYAQPKLQDRIDPFMAALVVGLVWALFHWVALLGNAESPWAYVLISTAHLTAMSVIMAFIFNRAREALPVLVLAHASYDTVSIGVVPLVGTGLPLLAFGLSAVVAWVVAAALVVRWGRDLGRTPAGQRLGSKVGRTGRASEAPVH